MTCNVSDLSNAELDLLLKDFFADGETMNDRLPSPDQPVNNDFADSVMDIDNETDADETLLDKVRFIESQLKKA